jgi:hypothetical protein
MRPCDASNMRPCGAPDRPCSPGGERRIVRVDRGPFAALWKGPHGHERETVSTDGRVIDMTRRTFLAALAVLALVPGLAVGRRASARTLVRDGWILREDDA